MALANAYLGRSGRWRDRRDGSCAPARFRMVLLHPVPPANPTLARGGESPLHDCRTAAPCSSPALWVISKLFPALVVERTEGAT